MDAFSKMLQKFAVHGQRERALSVLQRMHEEGLRADITTYNALLLLYINMRNTKEAEKVKINNCNLFSRLRSHFSRLSLV